MSASPAGSAPSEREIQIAIAPLETLLSEDLGAAAASVDQWLREATYDLVSLQLLRQAAESVPVVANALAGVDVLIDILTLVESPSPDPLQWVSLGINLMGVTPIPPGLSRARMVLRPVLQLTRQTLRRRPDAHIGAVILEIIDGHLHANIRGTLEHYVGEALAQLPAMLSAAADTARLLFTTLARTLEAAARGQLDAEASHQLSRAQMAEVALYDSLLNTDAWRLALSALANASEGNLKDAYNSVASRFGEPLESLLRPLVQTLDGLATSVPQRLEALGASGMENSIAWLLTRLLETVLANPRRPGMSANIRPGVTNQARHIHSEGPTEVVSRQAKAKKAPN
ncbi:RHS repeat protein, partial [Pseudomonas sp. MAFF 301350]|nr:RHS repeat protein [Pseudomonas aegrilactucae]